MALANKRPDRLLIWENRLREWVQANLGVSPDDDAHTAAITALSSVRMHDFRSLSVAHAFHKIVTWRQIAPQLRQLQMAGSGAFRVVRKDTGEDITDMLADSGRAEFTLYPKARWNQQLAVSLIIRLRNGGLNYAKIAALLPDHDAGDAAGLRRDIRRVAACCRKYLGTYRRDFAPYFATWPERVGSSSLPGQGDSSRTRRAALLSMHADSLPSRQAPRQKHSNRSPNGRQSPTSGAQRIRCLLF
jgi:hypothetical protein